MPAPLPSPVPPPRPWIIGHRGVPAERPENSPAGFARALDLGADGIELDVHATRDGVVVVHHDPQVPGLAREGGEIARLPWAALAAAGVPCLADVLALAAGRGTVYVELKATGLEEAVAAVLADAGAGCAVHAFDHRTVARLGALLPAVPRGILQASRLVDSAAALRAANAATLWQEWPYVDADLVAEVAAAGGAVIAWTVNDAGVARRLAACGVSGICTDDPAGIRRALAGG